MMLRSASIVCLVFSLAGCALTPSQVGVPKPPKDGKTWVEAEQDASNLSIPRVSDDKELRSQINVYAAYWGGRQGDLLLERDLAGRARDIAVLTAAYNAVKSHLKQARYGGIAAALFGSYSDTYQVEVQAKNYATASKMMACIGQAVDKVPVLAWGYFDKGEFTTTQVSFPAGREAENVILLNDTFPAINRIMNRVLSRLLDDQRNLKLSGVNLETLRAAYDKEKAALEKAVDNKPDGAGSNFVAMDAAGQAVEQVNIEARVTALKLLPADAEKCLGAGGG
jgi:hypothetical protein